MARGSNVGFGRWQDASAFSVETQIGFAVPIAAEFARKIGQTVVISPKLALT
jgi:hypothetical protein